MRLLLALLLALGPHQGPVLPFPGGGPFTTGTTPSNFAYVAGSVTGCINSNTGGTKCVYALHQNPGAGHLLICGTSWHSTTATNSFTSSNNTWTAVSPPKVGAAGFFSGVSGQLFYVLSANGGADTITQTISAAVDFNIWECAEYSYSGTLSSPDGTPIYSNTAASGGVATIGTVTTTGSSDLVSAHCLGVDSTCTAGTGFTSRNDAATCNYGTTSCTATNLSYIVQTGATLEDKVNVAAGAQSATFGTGTTDNVILGLIAF